MLELGAALGADVWWLEQVFAVAGGWVTSTPEAGVRTHLAELSRVAGDHAVALRSLLPRPAPVDPAGWVVAPSELAPGVVADVAALDASAARLAVVHRVLVTRLVTAWAVPAAPSAAGIGRAWRHARTDLAELRDEGEALLHALFAAAPAAVTGTGEVVASIEAALVEAGGLRPTERPSLPS